MGAAAAIPLAISMTEAASQASKASDPNYVSAPQAQSAPSPGQFTAALPKASVGQALSQATTSAASPAGKGVNIAPAFGSLLTQLTNMKSQPSLGANTDLSSSSSGSSGSSNSSDSSDASSASEDDSSAADSADSSASDAASSASSAGSGISPVAGIGALGSIAGGIASLMQATRPSQASAPSVQRANFQVPQIPLASVKGDLSMPTLSAGGSAPGISGTIPGLASARDYNLTHLLSALNGGF